MSAPLANRQTIDSLHWMSLLGLGLVVGCSGNSSQPVQPTLASEIIEPDLHGIVTARPADTPESLQEKQAKLAARLQLAQDCAQRDDLDEAIRLLEEAVLFDPRHRQVLLLLTQYSQSRSRELVTQDAGRSYKLMVKAGGYLRMLRETHSDFSTEERELIANILFDEACAHARANRREEMSGALRAAIDAGFNDLARLRTEPDLDAMRTEPALTDLFAEGARTIQSRQSSTKE